MTIDATASSCRRSSGARVAREGFQRPQQGREQQVVDGDAPGARRADERRELRRVEPAIREPVGGTPALQAAGPHGAPAAGRDRPQEAHAHERRGGLPEKQPSIGRRVAVEATGRRRFGLVAEVAGEDALEQDHDRVTAGDHMVVGEAEVEPRPVVDAEEPERIQPAIAHEGQVELAFDRHRQHVARPAAARVDGKRDLRRSSRVLEAAARDVEHEAGEPERVELARDERLQPRGVERTVDADHVNRGVRMQIPPAQHRRLEQVQAPLHSAPRRCAPTSRLASIVQCRFTLCQMSAA